MKGPGGRLRFDLRRLWECPACHRKEWTAGDTCYRACTCAPAAEPGRAVWMKLIEVDRARLATRPVEVMVTPAQQPGISEQPGIIPSEKFSAVARSAAIAEALAPTATSAPADTLAKPTDPQTPPPDNQPEKPPPNPTDHRP